MTFVDLLLLVLIVAIMATGFFQGTIRMIIAIMTFYASIVLSSLYFRFLTVFFTQRGTSGPVADVISLVLILLLCFVVLFVAGLYTFRYVYLPDRLDYVDGVLGMLLGLVLAAMAAVIVAIVLHYSFVRYDAAATARFPLTPAFQRSVRRSTLVPVLLEYLLPRLYSVVGPLLPDAAQPLFQPDR